MYVGLPFFLPVERASLTAFVPHAQAEAAVFVLANDAQPGRLVDVHGFVHLVRGGFGVVPRGRHVVDLLPASTRPILDAARLAHVRADAVIYNVGRGSTIDQDALLDALSNGRLAAAYLDVTSPEPLPPEHPLWHAPNCYVTPHTAGGHVDENERLVEHFVTNLARLLSGKPLLDRIA